MTNDWIAFYRNGEVRIDVVLAYGKDTQYPRYEYAMTPHYGKITTSSIIETRKGAPHDGE